MLKLILDCENSHLNESQCSSINNLMKTHLISSGEGFK